MTWSLNAMGHTPAAEGESSWEAVERELHDRLAEVLSDPKFGCSSSTFSGNYISGSPHTKAKEA